LINGRRKTFSNQTSLVVIPSGMERKCLSTEYANFNQNQAPKPSEVAIPAVKRSSLNKKNHSPYDKQENKDHKHQKTLTNKPVQLTTVAMKQNQQTQNLVEETINEDSSINSNLLSSKIGDNFDRINKEIDEINKETNSTDSKEDIMMERNTQAREIKKQNKNERLNQLDLSHITEKKINKVKRDNRDDRIKEIKNQSEIGSCQESKMKRKIP